MEKENEFLKPLLSEDNLQNDFLVEGQEANDDSIPTLPQYRHRLDMNQTRTRSSEPPRTWMRLFKELLTSLTVSDLIIGLWALINLILFIQNFSKYWNKPNVWVAFAKGFGQMLNFDCPLLLVPILRNVLTTLRNTALHNYFPWDSNIKFHRYLAWTIVVTGVLHAMAHYFDYIYEQHRGVSEWKESFGTLAGMTGHLISIVMIFMYTTAQVAVKRFHFNLFYLCHHLFIVFYFLLLLHGPIFWAWFLAPALLYIAEIALRVYRGKETTLITQVRQLPSQVIEIQMKKTKFKFVPGQYVYLNCPSLAPYEWHPFTLTSSPEQDFISVHIRCVGPWTNAVKNHLCPVETSEPIEINKTKGDDGKPLLRIDGPFGSASEDAFRFKTAVLIGAGIGVTPFASVLKSMIFRMRRHEKMELSKVYFFWICREYTAFEWFRELLEEIETEMQKRGYFVEINIYLTGEQKQDFSQTEGERQVDPYTHLQALTNFGRPDFELILGTIAERHRSTDVGVFFCGPEELSRKIKVNCAELSNPNDQLKLVFHKENF